MNERDVFDAALSIPGDAARRAYLETACAGDEVLRRRVESLLHAHEGARLFLERPMFPEAGRDIAPAEQPDGDGRSPSGPTEQLRPSGGRADFAADVDDETPLDFLDPSAKPGSLGRLSHYEVLEVVGRGGFGTVVKAFDEKLHRMVAIKVMARGLAATSPPRKRFLREARASAAIRHANVVSIHAVDERPIPYLVMEYIAGQTLQEKLDRVGPIEIPEVLRIGHQIAEGLAAAHRQGLIHRDIKPANILLEDAVERVKITDFGLARAADDASLTQSGTIAGTPMYMAPEQALGEAIDRRADLFSLGSVLYVMCTGRPPFRAPSTLAVLRRVAEDAPRPIREIIPEVPEGLCDLISRLHAKDPADRFASAEEVADLLKGLLEALRSPRVVPPTVAPPRSAARHKPAMIDSEFMTSARPRAKGSRPGHDRPWLALPRPWVLTLAVVAVLVLAEVTGISSFRGAIARLVSPRGTLVVQADDPGLEVIIIGDGLVINGPIGQRIWNYQLKPGRYQLLVREGYRRVLKRESVTILGNDYHVVRVDPEPEIAAAAPVPALPSKNLGSWGRLVDPLGGSRVTREGDRLTIAIPGDTHRHLNPMPWFNLDAPRVRQPADGDFSIRVTQLPSPRPGPADVDKARGDDGYQWAGLVVWADERNFLRFGVGRHPNFNAGAPFLDGKLHRDAKMADEGVRYTAEAKTHLRIDRRGGMLELKTSEDGLTWSEFKVCDISGFPPKVQVGVAAINSGTREFAARLEGWSLGSIIPASTDAEAAATPPASTHDLGPWGRLIDPLGGSRASREGDRLTIAIPGDAPRDLNPTPGFNLDAPRVLQAVDGDFKVQVEMLPYPRPRVDEHPAQRPNTYRWAGLVVWADERNFLRFGVAKNTDHSDGSPFLDLEFFRDLKDTAGDMNWTSEGPMRFQAERRGNTLYLRTSGDGRTWSDYKTCTLSGMPPKLYVGVAAINTGTKACATQFEGWSLKPIGPALP